jgi:hypothetical protein
MSIHGMGSDQDRIHIGRILEDSTFGHGVFERAGGFGRRKSPLMKDESENMVYGWLVLSLLMSGHSIRLRFDPHWEDTEGLDNRGDCI